MNIGKIEQAVNSVRNQAGFVEMLLGEGLDWPIERGITKIEDIAYGWSKGDLQIDGLEKHFVDGQIWQLQALDAGRRQPWGIFLLEFAKSDVFTSGRGLTGPLRRILRRLVPKRRQQPNHAVWDREHLLFICTYNYEYFSVAYFKEPPEGSKTPPLAIFGWGPDIPSRTAIEFNLPALDWPDESVSPDEWVAQWASAFDVEKVTSKFYGEYAELFRLVESLMPKSLATAEDRRLYTQSLMNRLMFLRFIERKGWLRLGKSLNYLQELFAATPPNASFYKTRLRRLFFEGLALEKHTARGVIGDVPFLNGGLFEEGPLDKQVEDIPNGAFDPILGRAGLFYRYNFTVEESTPLDIQVAVDPEMLGRVFEELVTGRHETGSYYTPRPVVSFMCREALKGYLVDKTGTAADAVARLVDKHDVAGLTETDARKIIQALDDLKAVDPACGSGAYLLGLLQEMVALYRLLYSEKLTKDSRSLYELKLRIISNNLYGVDIDPFATNIAMLRLWLSIAVDSDAPVPLPNLDFKIETGDSLTGPYDTTQGRLDLQSLRQRADSLVLEKEKFLTAHGLAKDEARKRITQAESEIAKDIHGLYGEGSIDWRVQFAEVFAYGRCGFDILVMNPPYISANRIPGDKRDAFGAYMDTLKGIFGFKSDLYVHFLYRALQLLRANGIFAAITSNTYLTNTTKTFLRKRLLAGDVRWLIPMGQDVFAATVYSGICIVQNRPPAPDALVGFLNLRRAEMLSLLNGHEALAAGHQIPASEYRQVFECLFFEPTPANRQLFSQLLSASDIIVVRGRRFVPLEVVAPALDTGIHSGNIRTRLFYETQPAGRRLPKLLQGKQVVKYWSCWDAPGAKFRYVDVEYVPNERRKGIGRGGKPSGKGEYWHFCGPPENHHVPERLLMRQTEDEPFVGYIHQGTDRIYTDNTLHTLLLTERGRKLGLSYLYLLAVLNSVTMRRIYQAVAQEEGRTLAQVKTTLVNRLPISLPSDSERTILEGLVREIHGLYGEDGVPLGAPAARRFAELQAQIDAAVARMYGLDGF